MDPLTDVLELAQVRGTVAATVQAGEAWGLDIADIPGAAFHAVTEGTAWLCLDGREPLRLMPGDLALLPAGTPHRLMSDPGQPCEPFDHVAARQALGTGGRLTVGTGQARTRILCASYHQDAELVLGLLPELIHVPADPEAPVEHVLRLLGHEIRRPRVGAPTVLDRLLDVLLVHILRAWLASQDADRMPPSWLAALRDPLVAAALTALHADPARDWTLDMLARRLAVSRATLVRRFPALVGRPPLAYLTSWRMELAARRLRTSDDPIGPIARAVGYTSEYAFNRAFTRIRGTTPGRYRAQHRP